MTSDLLFFPSPVSARPLRPSTSREMLSDTEAREAALDIQCSCIVEAPAGSGKTGLLIQRFLKLLAYADIQRPTEILVLTFTRKADGELRSRILEQLTSAHDGTPLPPSAGSFEQSTREFAEAVLRRDRDRDWRLLQSPSQLNIRTIDSFCADLARSMPLLAGGGQLHPIDDAFPLYQLAAERTLAQLGGADPQLHEALRLLLQHRDAQVTDCLRLLVDMLAQREQWSELIPLDVATLTDDYLDSVVRRKLDQTLQRIVSDGLQRAADAIGEPDLEAISACATRLSSRPGYKGDANPFAVFSHVQSSLPARANFLPQWKQVVSLLLKTDGHWRERPQSHHLKCDIDRNDLDWLQQFVAHLGQKAVDASSALQAVRELPPAEYPEEAWPLIKALCRILSHALVELRSVFTTRAQCDFTEVALTARALLRPDANASATPPTMDLLSTPAGSLNHLLVDEMQDTSSGQYSLLESLTEFWDGASQTVFLVGDPKQSIYAFRQARVERFLRTMATGRLGDLPLSPLRLTANFRSQASLVAAFNDTFTQIFAGPASEENGESTTEASSEENAVPVPFVAATPVRTAAPGPALHWHALPASSVTSREDPENASAERQDASQAQAIRTHIESFRASWAVRCQAQGLRNRPPTIAVLARNRSHFAPILSEFKRNRGNGPLPFRAVDVEALNERPEILDLLALTRALLHSADRVAWLAVLRSPLCGLSLADLLALVEETPQGADQAATIPFLVAAHQHRLSPEGQQLLDRAWPALSQAQQTLGATDFSTLVERTWRSLGGDAPLSAEQRRNAFRYLELLRKLQGSGETLSIPLLKRGLQRLYAEPATAADAVDLMTIHKAKGLEWDLVLIPSLDRGSGQNQHGLLKWLELDNPDHEADLLLAPIQSKGFDSSPLSTWLNRGVRRREAAEAQRLFYVACTRAREELHLFASVQINADGSLAIPTASTSLLRAAWPAAQPILEQQLHPAAANLISFPLAQSEEPLTLAAAADETPLPSLSLSSQPVERPRAPRIQRLPADFDLAARLRPANPSLLPYPSPETLHRSPVFTRPEGSFAARAFGNTIHRVLERLAARLAAGDSLVSLQEQIPSWTSRLTTLLRNEGLPANQALAEAQRATEAVAATLQHPEGAWILAPHHGVRSEQTLPTTSGLSGLRADRTFLAGPTPLLPAEATHLWIVDYKTAELGGRSQDVFLAQEKQKYLPQMEAYAAAAERAGTPRDRIMLALYFPLLPALLAWPADPGNSPE